MPLIKVQTSVAAPEKAKIESLLKTLSSGLAKHLGKPESYVMTAFEPDVAMTFAGTTDPVCYIEIKSIGNMTSTQTKSMSQDFANRLIKCWVSQLIASTLNLPTLKVPCGVGITQHSVNNLAILPKEIRN